MRDIIQKNGSRVLAFATIDLDYEWRIENIRISKTNDSRELVCCPSLVSNGGLHHDVAHPFTRRAREHLNETLLSMYHTTNTCQICDSQGSMHQRINAATVWYPKMNKWLCGEHDIGTKYFVGVIDK